ncbi:MAG: hypothetical protein WStaPseu_40470 [Shewanella algae]
MPTSVKTSDAAPMTIYVKYGWLVVMAFVTIGNPLSTFFTPTISIRIFFAASF